MDMMSPEGYRMDHENDSWEELLKERTRLIRSLRHYELHRNETEWEMCPSADLVYQFELEFLRELCILIRKAMCKEMDLVSFFDDDDMDDEDEGEDVE